MTFATHKDGPYSYKIKRTYTWFFPKFNILFDDTAIREYCGSVEELHDMIFLLNTAWAEGYNQGNLFGDHNS
jgi:hypothetical protein